MYEREEWKVSLSVCWQCSLDPNLTRAWVGYARPQHVHRRPVRSPVPPAPVQQVAAADGAPHEARARRGRGVFDTCVHLLRGTASGSDREFDSFLFVKIED